MSRGRSLQRGLREFGFSSNHSSVELVKTHSQALTRDRFEPSGFIFDSVSFRQFSDWFIVFHLLCNTDYINNERRTKMFFLNCGQDKFTHCILFPLWQYLHLRDSLPLLLKTFEWFCLVKFFSNTVYKGEVLLKSRWVILGLRFGPKRVVFFFRKQHTKAMTQDTLNIILKWAEKYIFSLELFL